MQAFKFIRRVEVVSSESKDFCSIGEGEWDLDDTSDVNNCLNNTYGHLKRFLGGNPASSQTIPSKAGTIPGEAGLIPGEAGTIPGEVGLIPGEAGLIHEDPGMTP
jgi:hypothetical protein